MPDPASLELTTAARAALHSDERNAHFLSSDPNLVLKHSSSGSDSYKPNDLDRAADFAWYEDYVARHAPLSLSWLQPALDSNKLHQNPLEVKGLAVFGTTGEKIVASLEDKSVQIWDVGRVDQNHDNTRGNIVASSRHDLLSAHYPGRKVPWHTTSRHQLETYDSVIESISVDRQRARAYFAVANGLIEVDLETLQLISHYRYPMPITALSRLDNSDPLTVGTTRTLHLHDPRWPKKTMADDESFEGRLDTGVVLPRPNGHVKLWWHTPNFSLNCSLERDPEISTILTEQQPLSILHIPYSQQIKVAGRFPTIFSYDRRFFPQVHGSHYSGGRLSSLACVSSPDRQDFAACGEYNGKGSLELYTVDYQDKMRPSPSYQNRNSASRSKLLSVAAHGSRIVYSDGDGMLKWVERDGKTHVRTWNINQFTEPEEPLSHGPSHRIADFSRAARRGLFGETLVGGDVARKILPLDDGARSELAIWTGEKIGIVGFGKGQRFGPWEDESHVNKEDKAEREVQERMKRALEHQAHEVRFMRDLGLDV